MIKKSNFLNLIRQGDFKELFISELGWNRYRGHSQLPTIIVDDREYDITAIAERSGFQILYCTTNEIPTQSVAKKIDTRLRRQALDYICIYRLRDSTHDLWVVPVRTNEKRDLVLVEYDNANAEVVFQKIDGISFDFDEQTNIVDLRTKVQTAFAVNSEKITKDFYAGFKKQHKAFADFITGIDDHVDTKNNRNKQWYASVMLNRMMFCYFIQKKGFLDLDVDYLRNKLNYVRESEGEDKFYNFYRDFLRRLFHDGLNTPKHSHEFELTFGKIPYLNGGMFEEHQLEAQYADIDIPDEAFIALFDFFDKWNWHLDTRLTASGKDINPDVLGYIFEQYINDRAQMGAYYTKEDITEYIGRNCILPYLFDQVRTATLDSSKEFESNGYVWHSLRESGDRYIFDAVKKGYKNFNDIPESIARGIITDEMRREYSQTPIGELPADHVPLTALRSEWNTRTPEPWGLPNEIWRESIERIQRCDSILRKIEQGEITSINDFITYNLDIRTFASELIANGDSRFVGWFYHALQKVTILDPTCGSGAFLFAAMNILEPLYEICIDRMQEFNRENPAKFKEELAEITDKYRSNIQYFIFKSIILRNLYGVDIMVEATEIAKLRLFLKMVAVVDVERRAENLGLDPLPDIDFNIRCGNTLVGYANKAQLDNDHNHAKDIMEELANQEFKEQIDEEMRKVAAAYRIFVYQQLRQEEDMMAFKQAKHDLRELLRSLNDKLNHRLYSATSPNISYEEWLKSHQPFNWLAEFYQIIEGNGGFDVIIGNPPYVVYTKKDSITKKAVSDIYQIRKNLTLSCNNLYAFIIERVKHVLKFNGFEGMIVPISSISSPSFIPLQKIMFKHPIWHASFSNRPGKLFQNVEQRLTIYITQNIESTSTFATKYQHWYSEQRNLLFINISYYFSPLGSVAISDEEITVNKIGGKIDSSILAKLTSSDSSISKLCLGSNFCYFHNGPTYFIRSMSFMPNNGNGMQPSSHYKSIISDDNRLISAILNSSTYYWYYKNISNCRDFSTREIYDFPICTTFINDDLDGLANNLESSYKINKVIKNRNYNGSMVYYEEYYPAKSKPIIDEIDTVLARHYGFTDEELDFIINYDIKYRMGDELNKEE